LPAEELGQSSRGQTIRRDRSEEGEHRQALAEVEVLRLLEEASVSAQRSAVVLLEVPTSKEESQFERFCKADELELRGGRELR
jgi:hypothetical protein